MRVVVVAVVIVRLPSERFEPLEKGRVTGGRGGGVMRGCVWYERTAG